MKPKEKNELIIAILCLVLAGIIIGYYIFAQHSSGGGSSVSSTDQTAASGQPLSPYLPNGIATLDTTVITDSNSLFKQLIPPEYPTVSDSEIGNQNLFAPLQ